MLDSVKHCHTKTGLTETVLVIGISVCTKDLVSINREYCSPQCMLWDKESF